LGLTVCSDSMNYAGRTPPPPRSSTPSTLIERDGDDLRSHPFLDRKGELVGRFLNVSISLHASISAPSGATAAGTTASDFYHFTTHPAVPWNDPISSGIGFSPEGMSLWRKFRMYQRPREILHHPPEHFASDPPTKPLHDVPCDLSSVPPDPTQTLQVTSRVNCRVAWRGADHRPIPRGLVNAGPFALPGYAASSPRPSPYLD